MKLMLYDQALAPGIAIIGVDDPQLRVCVLPSLAMKSPMHSRVLRIWCSQANRQIPILKPVTIFLDVSADESCH